ncbi:MAG: general secretion pathway protein GspE, partial [Campylobacterales bacterium]
MDRVTHDLLENNHISQTQIDRLVKVGVKEESLLETLTKVGAVSVNFVKRFIVEQIRAGKYNLDILKQYTFLPERAVLEYLAEVLEIQYVDLDSIDMDYRLAERAPLNLLQKSVALPIEETDMSITVAFGDPLNIDAQEGIQRIFPRKPLQVA